MRTSRQALGPLFLAAADSCTTLQAFRADSAAYPPLPPRGSRAALLAAAPTGWTGLMLLAQEHQVPMIETGRPLPPLLPGRRFRKETRAPPPPRQVGAALMRPKGVGRGRARSSLSCSDGHKACAINRHDWCQLHADSLSRLYTSPPTAIVCGLLGTPVAIKVFRFDEYSAPILKCTCVPMKHPSQASKRRLKGCIGN